MIYIFLILLVSWLLFRLYFPNIGVLVVMSSAIVFSLALLGIIPFLLHEYLDIGYSNAAIWILLLLSIVFVCSLFVIDRKNFKDIANIKKLDLPSTFVIVLTGILFVRGLYLPIQGWDAYALYDARALMLIEDERFADMARFSTYDDFNVLYYLSYPPMTSLIHAMLYLAGIGTAMPIYALFFGTVLVGVLAILREYRAGIKTQMLALVLVSLNPLLITQTTIAYTNLPMVSFQMMALVYLVYFLNNQKLAYLLVSGMFLGFGSWTRSLEPTFIGYILAVIYILFFKSGIRFRFQMKVFLLTIYTVLCLFWRHLWNYYVAANVGVYSEGETNPSISLALIRLIDALSVGNILDVGIFLLSSLDQIILYITLAVVGLISLFFSKYLNKVSEIEYLLLIIIVGTLGTFALGTLYFSQTFEWWDQIGGSLLRSNLLLVPVITLYSLIYVDRMRSSAID